MEEKERYEIHIYDDVCVDLYDNGVLNKFVNDTYKLEKLLNQQDREINRLTKMLYTTTKHADKLNEENNKLNKIIKANIISADKVVKENKKLKQQLEEKDKIEYTDTINFVETSEPDIVAKELDRLNKQLAEKDKEIEKLTEELDYKNFWNDFVDLYTGNKLKTQMLHENCKDKISFAVEQLEKVKEFVSRQLFITTKDCNDLDEAEAKGCNELREETIKEIDNQIKELKGEK